MKVGYKGRGSNTEMLTTKARNMKTLQGLWVDLKSVWKARYGLPVGGGGITPGVPGRVIAMGGEHPLFPGTVLHGKKSPGLLFGGEVALSTWGPRPWVGRL